MAISRCSVSLENELLEALDAYVETNRFPTRSQAIRHLIERNVVEQKWQCNNLVAGAVILVYNCHKRDLIKKLADAQHLYQQEILSIQRFPLAAAAYLEIIAVRGKAYRLTELADRLIAIKGVRHGKLLMTKYDDAPEKTRKNLYHSKKDAIFAPLNDSTKI
jgi:CopG family nickel-responsive transcriptional regulator